MRLIDAEAGQHHFAPDQWRVVKRMIHATADFDFMRSTCFHAAAVKKGVGALRSGCSIYCDTAMMAAGIQKHGPRSWGCSIVCTIQDPDLGQVSARTGKTRSALAFERAGDLMEGGIIAIGNAPTALEAVIDLCCERPLKPALVIGLPVGFVGALQSKQRLARSELVFITNLDRKGGTPAAVAAINALAMMAAEASL